MLTQTVRLKLSNFEQEILTLLCRLSKNMFNVGLYTLRQYFFQTRKDLSYESSYHLCKQNENYQLLATDCAQQTLKYVDRCFKAFFKLLSMVKDGIYQEKVNLPRYLPKDAHFPLIIPIRARHDFAKDNWHFKIPTSRTFAREYGSVYISVPPNIRGKRINEIRVLPKQKGKFIDAAFVYESGDETVEVDPSSALRVKAERTRSLDTNKAIAIDFGVKNLATVVSTTNESFIVDGRWLKSKNQWFNKRRAKLSSHKDKQGIKHLTNKEAWLSDRRKNQVNNYLNKAARYIVSFCLNTKIGTIVVGYNPTLKQNPNLGKRNNQTAVATTGGTAATRCLNFVQIPIFTLRSKLESLCERYGLNYIEQEESYTSKASAIDRDELPVYHADNPVKPKFSGRRLKRGLYKSKTGHLVNADCNGSLNIGFKSKHDGFGLVSRVCLTQPARVNVLQDSATVPLAQS